MRPRDAPTRPSLPPLLVGALCSWTAVFLAEELSWRSFANNPVTFSLPCAYAIACILILAALAMARVRRRGTPRASPPLPGRIVLIALVSSCCSLACGLLYWNGWAHDVDELPALLEQEARIQVELTGDPASRDFGFVSDGRIRCGGHAANVRVQWPDGADAPASGHSVMATGTFRATKSTDSGRWNHQNGIVGTLAVRSFEDAGHVAGLRGAVTSFRDASFERISALGGDAAGLLAGVLLGNRTLYAGSELEQAFKTTGLAHLMAVSGTHLAIVTMLVSLLLGRTPLGRRLRSVLIVAALVIYAALTGFAASALRACVMCVAALSLGILRRRGHVLGALSLCVFCFLGLSPPIAFSLGFQLSVLAVFGLVMFASLATCWVESLLPTSLHAISSSVAATLAATFLTLPVTIPQFAQLPLVSPIANLLAAPLVSAALCMGIVALVAGALLPPVGAVLLVAAGAMASVTATIVRALSSIPFACLPLSSSAGAIALVFLLVAGVLWIRWPLPSSDDPAIPGEKRSPRKPLALAALLCPLVIAIGLGLGHGVSPGVSQSRIVMLDVGQGDSMLVQSGDATLLVDTGEKADILARELAEQGVTHLDAVIITHKDADHAGALAKMAGVVDVGHVYVHADLLEADIARNVLDAADWVTNGHGAEGIRPGARIDVGAFKVTMIAPEDGGKSENDDSIVCLIEFDVDDDGTLEARGLLTGDAESKALANVIPKVGDIDFLKVAHHGSKGGLSAEQLSTLKPEVGLIGVGANNRYGHPTKETLDLLDAAGTRVYRTDEHGAICMSFADQGILVATER